MSDTAPTTWRPATQETPLVRRLLIGVVLAVLALLLFAPLVTVFHEALRKGWLAAVTSLADPEALSAIRLTLTVAAIAVPAQTVRRDASGRPLPLVRQR